MQDKQKVTLYLPHELHRKLKVRSAIDSEPMSAIAERAIVFYLTHSDVVEEVESSAHGETHRVYACPDCASSLVIQDGELEALTNQPGVIDDEELSVSSVSGVHPNSDQQGEELVPC
jgi:hypothetical protein